MSLRKVVIAASVAVLMTGCGPHLAPHAGLPSEFHQQYPELTPPPSGEPEGVRYRHAYDAFWWNCAVVRSRDLDARCPMTCSGTPAATYGCSQGALDADGDIDDLIERYGRPRTQSHLQALVRRSDVAAKMNGYFADGPVAEDGPPSP